MIFTLKLCMYLNKILQTPTANKDRTENIHFRDNILFNEFLSRKLLLLRYLNCMRNEYLVFKLSL